MPKITINRIEQSVRYYWTGWFYWTDPEWTTNKGDARHFDSIQSAHDEMHRQRMQYTVSCD